MIDPLRALISRVFTGLGLILRPEASRQPLVSENVSLSQAALRYYLYLSDAKVDMLESQIAVYRRDVLPAADRYAKLQNVLVELDKHGMIGPVGSRAPYVAGRLMMRWGVVDWGTRKPLKTVFFVNADYEPAILMAGSTHHLLGRKAQVNTLEDDDLGVTGSNLPGIMRSIKIAFDRIGSSWVDTLGGIEDYLFGVLFAEGKYLNNQRLQPLGVYFYQEEVNFVARYLTTLSRPTSQQATKYLQRERLLKEDRQVLAQALHGPQELLICTPLYVALDDNRAQESEYTAVTPSQIHARLPDTQVNKNPNVLAHVVLHELLTQRFSDDELRTLCFELSVDYENLPGQGKAGKARELVVYMEHRQRRNDLIAAGRRQRPDINWNQFG